MHFEYPYSLRTTTADDYHGHRIEDPYRWMEALETPEVKAWIEAQNAVTDRYLASLPLRERLRARISELWNYAKVSMPVVENGRLFYQKNTGLEKQPAIYMHDRLNGPPALVLDPNALSPDGSVALMAFAPSPDARLLAYTLAEAGADWQTVHVRDLDRGEGRADRVRWMRFSALSWTMWVTVNLRGGSEYGEAWHRAGMREQKQNVFDDFMPWPLIADGYTSASRLAMIGGSNGGLLVAVAMEQRPELVAAAVPIVGVLDMLRYDRFTSGRAGSPSTEARPTRSSSSSCAPIHPFTISLTADAIPPRWSAPPTTMTESSRVIRSSSSRLCSGPRGASGRP